MYCLVPIEYKEYPMINGIILLKEISEKEISNKLEKHVSSWETKYNEYNEIENIYLDSNCFDEKYYVKIFNTLFWRWEEYFIMKILS